MRKSPVGGPDRLLSESVSQDELPGGGKGQQSPEEVEKKTWPDNRKNSNKD